MATVDEAQLLAEIETQGGLVRQLKADPASSEEAKTAAIEALKALKIAFKEKTGKEVPGGGGARQPKKADKEKEKPKKEAEQPKDDGAGKRTKLGIDTPKAVNYSDWYSQVITKSEMIEYYDVSGCYVLRPWSYAIWEQIQSFFDTRIKSIGVENCYFPMFVSKAALVKEATHIADFAPEVAWVTRAGQSEMAEPVAIRPTSETVMYPSFAKWVQSHRDLPIRLNQWCNVVRWEFKHPTPFLRTREFLWQEGHTAFATKEEAIKEVFQILDFYAAVYQELLAIPVVKGRKSEKEKFAGGDFTTTVEAYVPVNGRGIQGATSHHLGQNFSRMFNISFETAEEGAVDGRKLAYQNSWGLSTRTIGALVMIHGDDQGLVLPPRVARIQVVVLVVGVTGSTTAQEKEKLVAAAQGILEACQKAGVRAHLDDRDNYTAGWKFNHWELKGVPLRVEVGPKDVAAKQVTVVTRYDGTRSTTPSGEGLGAALHERLEAVQAAMFNKAKAQRDTHLKQVRTLAELRPLLDERCIVLAPFCGRPDCEDKVKKDSASEAPTEGAEAGIAVMGAKTLCIPVEQPQEPVGDKCLHPACTEKPQFWALWGRSY